MSRPLQLMIGASCWARLCAELDRVLPGEGLAVPLISLRRRRPLDNPCATVELSQLQRLVIAEAVLVPRALQVNGWARVSVLPATDEVVNRRVLALIDRHPALRACAYLHSHPFARGWTRPSRGRLGDVEGHMLPLLARNREAGLDASFSFIACRDQARGWLLHGFALTSRRREVLELGLVEVVPDHRDAVRRALLPPLQRRSPWRYLLRRWRRELRRRGLRPRVDELFGGWLRVRVGHGAREVVHLLPIDLPREPARHYLVDGVAGSVRRLEAEGSVEAWIRLAEREVRRVRRRRA